MKLIIDIPEEKFSIIKNKMYCGIYDSDLYKAIVNGTPHETVTEFADRCRECGAKYGKLLEQKSGKWIGIDEEPHEDYECDKCGYVVSTFTANIKPSEEYKYCPNCGAKMESEDEDKG